MKLNETNLLEQVTKEHDYPLLFTTVSGAHLYGFPSPDSDFDLRGTHIVPMDDVLGLGPVRETIDRTNMREGKEIDLVSHDVRKFFGLMLKPNGYVLEQLYSPLVIHAFPEHEELKALGMKCLTRHHAHHYLGFARNQWALFQKENPPRVKPLLYMYRVILTGIHLMRTGEVQADLALLNEDFKLPYLNELIQLKVNGAEKQTLEADLAFHESEYERLCNELKVSQESTSLPEAPSAKAGMSDLLVRLRKKYGV